MARKGPQQDRRGEPAAGAHQEPRRQDSLDPAHATLHDSAAATRGASPGSGARRHSAPRGQDSDQESSASAGAADFAHRLAELAAPELDDSAAAVDKDRERADSDFEAEVQFADAGAGAAGPQSALHAGAGGRSGATRKQLGGDSDPDDMPGSASPATRAQGVAEPGEETAHRVRPKKRAEHVELQALLEQGVELGLLDEYRGCCVAPTLERLTWGEFAELQEALDLCETEVQRIIILAALAAHRATAEMNGLAAYLVGRSDQDLLDRLSSRAGAAAPGEQTTIDELRLWYDPIAALAGEARATTNAATPAEAWSIPRWLRGVPTEPLEMAAVALDQSLCGDLHPDQPIADGADELLTRALEHHGKQHPSLQRWFLTLCARADSRETLLVARETILRARNQLRSGELAG